MELRDERPQDAAAIAAVTTAAFAGRVYASGTEAAIVDALRAAGALAVSLVAVEEGEVVGHVAVSPVTMSGRDVGWFGLGPVSVRPDRQGCGVGGALIRAALDRLRERAAAGCVLLGDPAYYARFGFANDPALRYPGPPPAYFQRLLLNGPAAAGVVAYHPAFEAG